MENNFNVYPQWYRDIRYKAFKMDETMDWPSPKEEAWRRTEIKRLNLDRLYMDPPEQQVELHKNFRSFQTPGSGQKHLRLATLEEAIAGDFPGAKKLLKTALDQVKNRFQARLLAEAPQGFYFYLPKDYQTEDILFLEDRIRENQQHHKGCSCGGSCGCQTGESTGECECGGGQECSCKDKKESFTLNMVVLEEGAKADLWERISQEVESPLIHNRATLFLLQKDSSLNYHRTQSLNGDSCLFDFSIALLQERAEFFSFQAEGEIHLNKSHLLARMEGKEAHVEMKGIYTLSQDHFCEIFTEQDHQAPHCVSHALYRGVLEDKARAVYNGVIRVDKNAVKTDAYLTNNNLLMNDGCRADSIPGLQIATNDVKCSHGSTTGKINPEQIFYLTSRGFSERQAKEILTQSFLEEVMQGVHSLVKKEISHSWGLAWEETA